MEKCTFSNNNKNAKFNYFRSFLDLSHMPNVSELKISYQQLSQSPQKKVEDEAINFENKTDEELDKYHKFLLLKYNKMKEKKFSLENSDIKKKKIKRLHEYNEIKVIFKI